MFCAPVLLFYLFNNICFITPLCNGFFSQRQSKPIGFLFNKFERKFNAESEHVSLFNFFPHFGKVQNNKKKRVRPASQLHLFPFPRFRTPDAYDEKLTKSEMRMSKKNNKLEFVLISEKIK